MNYLTNWRNETSPTLRGMYRGCGCVLVCGGPSLNDVDLSLLNQRGVLVAAVNNVAVTHVRPHLWFSYDGQHRFHLNLWRDPAIVKFLREENLARTLNQWDVDQFVNIDDRPRDCPNVWGYKSEYGWNPKAFLTSEKPTGGTNEARLDPDGTAWHQSVMLPTLRILFDLGIRRLYLLGCDFTFGERPYCFDETFSPDQTKQNESLYPWLNQRFAELVPHFEEHKYKVWNCTEGGALTAFPRMALADAIARETRDIEPNPVTKGHYR